MKYDEKYPHAKLNEECEPGLFVSDKAYPCMMCGTDTRWVQVMWYGPLCSEECEQKLNEEYVSACQPHPSSICTGPCCLPSKPLFTHQPIEPDVTILSETPPS